MKKLIIWSSVVLATGCADACGYSQRGNETRGYVKFVTNSTPIFCPDYTEADIDMKTPGVMTSERVRYYVRNQADAVTLRKANLENKPVKITSDEYRMTWCVLEDVITNAQIIEETEQ